jgi:hypothetical protein
MSVEPRDAAPEEPLSTNSATVDIPEDVCAIVAAHFKFVYIDHFKDKKHVEPAIASPFGEQNLLPVV